MVLMIAWKTRPARALWQALLIGGLTGFGCAIGVHYTMGYEIVSHLIPAWTGATIYTVGIICLFPASTSNARAPGNRQ